MTIITHIFLFIFGAIFGSFAVAQVHRLRFHQLSNQKNLDRVEKQEFQNLQFIKNSKDHSVCLSCGYQLKWYDLLPVASWLALGGKCRKCHAKIGLAEILTEVTLGVVFVLTYIFFPYPLSTPLDFLRLAIFLIILVAFAILFLYDLKYQLFPSLLLTISLCFAIIFLALNLEGLLGSYQIQSLIGAFLILPGLYLFLYLISKGKFVGSGDYILCISITLILPTFLSAFSVLFLANLLGSLYALILLARHQLKKQLQIPFGPLLIIAFFIVFLLQTQIVTLMSFAVPPSQSFAGLTGESIIFSLNIALSHHVYAIL